MPIQELQLLLRRGFVPLDQPADIAQAIRGVRVRHPAGLLDLRRRMALRQADQSIENPQTLDAALRQHGLGPAAGLRPDRAGPLQQPRRAAFNGRDLLGHDVAVLRAEAARLAARVNGDLDHHPVEDPHQVRVPPHPHLTADIFRRGRVEGPRDRHVAIALHGARRLLEAREPLHRQR